MHKFFFPILVAAGLSLSLSAPAQTDQGQEKSEFIKDLSKDFDWAFSFSVVDVEVDSQYLGSKKWEECTTSTLDIVSEIIPLSVSRINFVALKNQSDTVVYMKDYDLPVVTQVIKNNNGDTFFYFKGYDNQKNLKTVKLPYSEKLNPIVSLVESVPEIWDTSENFNEKFIITGKNEKFSLVEELPNKEKYCAVVHDGLSVLQSMPVKSPNGKSYHVRAIAWYRKGGAAETWSEKNILSNLL